MATAFPDNGADPFVGHDGHTPAFPRVYVCLLNWNGWADTIACLESVLRSDYPNFRVLLCDNASTDGSVERFRQWAAGELQAPVPESADLKHCTAPPFPKPLTMPELGPDEDMPDIQFLDAAPVVLLHSGANRGYAGGNNVALRHALHRGDGEYYWLLNNDTLVLPDSLAELVHYCERHGDVGLCGSTLLEFDPPHRVQALGGARFNLWLGTHRALGAGREDPTNIDPAETQARMSYVIGASMFASRQWLEQIGLLCEDYFLYFEEIDWAVRGRGRLRLGYAPGSIVYHKEGATIGRPARSARADIMALRNRLRFTRKRYPWALPIVWLGFLGVVVNRIRRGQGDRIAAIISIMFGVGRRADHGGSPSRVKQA